MRYRLFRLGVTFGLRDAIVAVKASTSFRFEGVVNGPMGKEGETRLGNLAAIPVLRLFQFSSGCIVLIHPHSFFCLRAPLTRLAHGSPGIALGRLYDISAVLPSRLKSLQPTSTVVPALQYLGCLSYPCPQSLYRRAFEGRR